MSPAHTPGPWRWEFNAAHKTLSLVGGQPRQYDLTVMDFARWGMSRATILLRDTSVDGMNVMHKLHERPEWIAPIPGREHHADWCATVTHPDARLIAAAPKLLAALHRLLCAADAQAVTLDERAAARSALAEATGGRL